MNSHQKRISYRKELRRCLREGKLLPFRFCWKKSKRPKKTDWNFLQIKDYEFITTLNFLNYSPLREYRYQG